MRIKKCNELVYNFYDKSNYVALKRTLKQALNHGLTIKKVHTVIQSNQRACIK